MKRFKIISIIIFLIIKCIINAQSTHNIIYENKFHQSSLPENLNTAFYLFDYIDSLLIPKSIPAFQNKFDNSILRLSNIFLTNYLVTDYMLTMNHEFGHGYRMIETGGAIKKLFTIGLHHFLMIFLT